ncbi:hypothetical protein LTR37_010176 [Vermiconidia calcicola]|uniref:Uncharacterized protein n=1 Tax=Vermiconidia calcicola TaxID=1690605 RepID=A0ACC3N7I3_9PEZI|nr:hypothetical protein LTR37_010176 [Vermiconidia calcicola]
MTPPKLETVLASVEKDGIGLIKFNRPKNANALAPQMMSDLLKAFAWALHEPEVKVVVLTGEGKFFCAGMDLIGVPDEGPVLSDQAVDTLSQMHQLLIKAEKVFIAAVNGPAVGWGTSSIALFDLVYSVPDAIFFTPFVKWGLCAEACSSYTFTKVMGRQKASALILAGERMTPQELESAGLLTKVLPRDGFLEEVMKVARRVAAQPEAALRYSKNLMMEPVREGLLVANERECEGLRERGRTSEPREAIAAFEREQKERRGAKL